MNLNTYFHLRSKSNRVQRDANGNIKTNRKGEVIRQKDSGTARQLACRVSITRIMDEHGNEIPKKVVLINLGEKLNPSQWDKDSVKATAKAGESRDRINKKIEEYRTQIPEIIQRMIEEGFDIRDINANEIKARLGGSVRKSQNVIKADLIGFFDWYIENRPRMVKRGQRSDTVSVRTISKLKTTRNQIEEFLHQRKEANGAKGRLLYGISAIDRDFISELRDFFLKVKKMKSSSIETRFKILRSVINEAKTRGIDVNIESGEFATASKTFKAEVEKTALREKELEALRTMRFSPSSRKHSELVRDMLSFMTETALRISDCIRLSWNSIEKRELKGQTFLVINDFQMQKTGGMIRGAVLSDEAVRIALKWKDHSGDRDTLFPLIGKSVTQLFNKELKKLAKECRMIRKVAIKEQNGSGEVIAHSTLAEQISSHIGRRTFVTNAIRNKWSMDQIMSYTGHKSKDEIMRYIGDSSENNFLVNAESILKKRSEEKRKDGSQIISIAQ